MDYFCDVCNTFIERKSKYKHFKSDTHKEFDNGKLIILTIENPDKNNFGRAFYASFIEHYRKFEYYLMKCQFKLVLIDYNFCPYITSTLSVIKAMCSW